MAFKTQDMLKQVLAERKMTQSDLARAIGVRPQAVQQWLSGRTQPRGKNLEALSLYLGLSPAIISSGSPEGRSTIELENGLIAIPRFNVFGACDPAGYENGYAEVVSMVEATREWLESKCPGVNKNHLEVLTAHGDSMKPTINNLDFVFVDRSITTFYEEGVYAVQYGGDTFIKRLQRRLDGGINLISDNPKYPPIIVPPEDMDKLVIQGRVRIACSAHEI